MEKKPSASYTCFMALCKCQCTLAALLEENCSQLCSFVCSVIVEVKARDCQYNRSRRSHFMGECVSVRMNTDGSQNYDEIVRHLEGVMRDGEN